jgi:YggT family protein
MISLVLLTFVDLFAGIFNLLLIVRVVSSYVARPNGRYFMALMSLTEPVLGPVRRFLPATPGLDLAPLVAFFLLQGLQYVAHWVLRA